MSLMNSQGANLDKQNRKGEPSAVPSPLWPFSVVYVAFRTRQWGGLGCLMSSLDCFTATKSEPNLIFSLDLYSSLKTTKRQGSFYFFLFQRLFYQRRQVQIWQLEEWRMMRFWSWKCISPRPHAGGLRRWAHVVCSWTYTEGDHGPALRKIMARRIFLEREAQYLGTRERERPFFWLYLLHHNNTTKSHKYCIFHSAPLFRRNADVLAA